MKNLGWVAKICAPALAGYYTQMDRNPCKYIDDTIGPDLGRMHASMDTSMDIPLWL